MNSTDEKPLDFFEYIINPTNLSLEIENQLKNYDVQGFHFINPVTIGYVEQNEFGEFDKHEMKVESLFIPLLYREFQKSKNHLYNFSTHNLKEVVTNYLRIQFNIIQNIINQKHHFLNKNGYFLLPLRGLVNYINDVLIYSDMEKYELNEDSIKVAFTEVGDVLFDSNQQTDNELISSIFTYMNGINAKREQILSNDDFKLLIKYTEELISNGKIPEIERQLEPKISNGAILISYWVLHHELYTTNKIRHYFYDFIKEVFINFKNSKVSSIKKQFGTKSRVYKEDNLPKIISKHL